MTNERIAELIKLADDFEYEVISLSDVADALRELQTLRESMPDLVYLRSDSMHLLYCRACGATEKWIPEHGHEKGCKFAGIQLPKVKTL